MPEINQLSSSDTFTSTDQVPMWSSTNGNAMKVAGSVMLEYFEENIEPGNMESFYSAPSATGFTVTITDTDDNYWVILTPVAGYAAGTIVLPSSTTATDRQTINVNCTQAVTTLTINGNGATVTGAPTTLAANAFFTLRFDAVTSTWYRVG